MTAADLLRYGIVFLVALLIGILLANNIPFPFFPDDCPKAQNINFPLQLPVLTQFDQNTDSSKLVWIKNGPTPLDPNEIHWLATASPSTQHQINFPGDFKGKATFISFLDKDNIVYGLYPDDEKSSFIVKWGDISDDPSHHRALPVTAGEELDILPQPDLGANQGKILIRKKKRTSSYYNVYKMDLSGGGKIEEDSMFTEPATSWVVYPGRNIHYSLTTSSTGVINVMYRVKCDRETGFDVNLGALKLGSLAPR